MPATPAEVANDLAAQAKFFVKRDDEIARLCQDCARLIRASVAGEVIDLRALGECLDRLIDRQAWIPPERGKASQIDRSLHRALLTLEKLRE